MCLSQYVHDKLKIDSQDKLSLPCQGNDTALPTGEKYYEVLVKENRNCPVVKWDSIILQWINQTDFRG